MGRFDKTFASKFKPRKRIFKVKARRVDCRPPHSRGPAMSEAEQIAAKLTEAQRDFLVQINRPGFSIHPGMQTRAIREFLRDAERLGLLSNPSFDNYFMQPPGLAVRQILQGDQ